MFVPGTGAGLPPPTRAVPIPFEPPIRMLPALPMLVPPPGSGALGLRLMALESRSPCFRLGIASALHASLVVRLATTAAAQRLGQAALFHCVEGPRRRRLR